jgi:hypothetical protein
MMTNMLTPLQPTPGAKDFLGFNQNNQQSVADFKLSASSIVKNDHDHRRTQDDLNKKADILMASPLQEPE